MKRHLFTFLFVFITMYVCYGQQIKSDCKCSENKMSGTTNGQEPDSSFYFSNGQNIILCGFKNSGSLPSTFSEFTLSICGQDTIIDFWDATLTCKLTFKIDTLLIEDTRNLPAAIERQYQVTTWSIEKIYFANGKISRHSTVNRNIRKYTQQEIQQTIKEYETAKNGLDELKMQLANRLFMSTISGDKQSRQYFLDFKTKFGTLDGAFSEEYSDLKAMLGIG